MAYPVPSPTAGPFLTRGLKWWLALFCVVHLLGFAIMAGTDAGLWVSHDKRMTPAWVRFSELPAFTCEPGFALAYFTSPSNSEAELTLRTAPVILLSDAALWLLPVFGVRWLLWSSRRSQRRGFPYSSG